MGTKADMLDGLLIRLKEYHDWLEILLA